MIANSSLMGSGNENQRSEIINSMKMLFKNEKDKTDLTYRHRKMRGNVEYLN